MGMEMEGRDNLTLNAEASGYTFESRRARHFARARWRIQICAGVPGSAPGALFCALVGDRWKVAPKVHSVVEDPHDFDRAVWRCPIHQEVTSAATRSRNVERAKTYDDLIPGFGANDIGAVGEFANRQNERVPIDVRLSRAKILGSPFENVGKIDFCGSAETNPPSVLGHEDSIRLFWR
jgi:hypothetical protein